jgi:predicted metal-dependent peptidase
MIEKKNIHEKILRTVQEMIVDLTNGFPYYGEFNLYLNFHDSKTIPTCAVNVGSKGMNFFYNTKFLEDLSQKEVNFIVLHEDFHLLFNHPQRTMAGQYDHKLANIVQDMIINHIIWEDISHNFVEIPKDKEGRNMALFVPKEYKGKLIFEELYEWMRDKKEEHDKKKKESQYNKDQKGQGDDDEQNDQNQGGNNNNDGNGGTNGKGQPKKDYGPYGKNPKGDGSIDTYSLDQIFEDMESNNGEYLDVHLNDEVPQELREAMVREIQDSLQSRGLTSGNIETTLNKLQKKRKDYLKEIKRTISNTIMGTKKTKTICKPNRKGIQGFKGTRKIKTKINVILDTSGSMGGQGTFERVLSYVYQNDIEINFIQGDTDVKWVENFKNKRKLETMKIHGLGGTVMQPSLDYVVENFNDHATVLLTDGYTDSLDCSRLKHNLLIISVGTPCPITRSNGKVKQITLENTH